MKKTMKKALAIVLAIFMIVATVPMTFAATEVANGTAGDGITWVLDSDGTLTISGTGAIVVDWYAPPWEDYNDSITSLVVEEGITEIPSSALCYAEKLVTASVPASVTKIGESAFWKCTSLEEINVHEDNTVYKSIDGILFSEDEKTLVTYPQNKAAEEYTVPAFVTTIGAKAFHYNKAVKSVVIPDTVTSIGEDIFGYSYTESVTLGNGIKTIPRGAFEAADIKSIVIPDTVESIGYAAFYVCSYLNTVIIGSNVKEIGGWMFNACYALSTIHYKGTQEAWNEIAINADNEGLNSKALHFISEDDYKAETAPTCADGNTAGYYCDDCEAYLTGEVIPAVDEHTPGAEVEENIVSPDCTTAGSKDVVTYCTVCGEEASRETVETAAALGHDWNNSVCGNCGETCAHDDDDYDEICDECEAEVPIEEVKLEETNTIYIPEEGADVVVKFTPTETGEYVIYSDNGGDDDNIDPYVDIYDSNGNYVEDDDDHNGSHNFYCIFEAEAGETYYIELSAYESEVEYDYTIEKYVEISHQPTAGEPYVELNWDVDADYQWYSVEVGDAEVTDENAEAYSYDGETATYDSENGWTPIIDADGYQSSATLELNEGDKVVVEFAVSGFEDFGFYDWEQGNESGCGSEIDDVLTYECTIDEDGVYTFFVDNPVAHKIYVGDVTYTAIDGETDATLQNPEIGTTYACKVTFADDTTEMSDVFEYVYAITHQPTAEEPYVELNDDTDATYQWYSVKDNSVEITDENADTCTYNNTTSSYNAETGWTGATEPAYYDETLDYYVFFETELKAGDTVEIKTDGLVDDYIGLDCDYYYYTAPATGVENDTYAITVKQDGTYYLYCWGEPGLTVKAYIADYEYTAIDGATDALYAPTEEGLYACEVTFADGTTEMSEVYEGPHTHDDADNDGYCDGCDECVDPSVECDHNCHKGGIAGFFWKIVNFFNKLFGTNQVCECGEFHYLKKR